jgi:hypothetical protein
MTDASHAMTDRRTAARHGWPTIIAITAVGAAVFTIALRARASIVVSFGLVLVAWLAAYLVARRRDSALAGSLVAALPAIAVVSIVIWLLVLFGGAGG